MGAGRIVHSSAAASCPLLAYIFVNKRNHFWLSHLSINAKDYNNLRENQTYNILISYQIFCEIIKRVSDLFQLTCSLLSFFQVKIWFQNRRSKLKKLLKQKYIHKPHGGNDVMLSYNRPFGSPGSEHFNHQLTSSLRSEYSPMESNHWPDPNVARHNLLLESNAYPAIRQSMTYPIPSTSLANDVTEAPNEQVEMRWSSHHSGEGPSFNSSFFTPPHHPRTSGITDPENQNFSGQATDHLRPDVMIPRTGIVSTGRNF